MERNEGEEAEEDAASAHGCLSHYERGCAPAGVRRAPSWARPAADCCCGSSSSWPPFFKIVFFFLFLNQVVFTPLGLLGIRLEGGGWNGVGGRGREGGRRGKGEGGCVQGEVDKPRAQCLPRISKNVPLERSHTRHGRNQCAPSHTYTCLIYIHEQATNDRVRTVGGCHRLLGSPRLIWIDGSGSRGAGDCARHHPFIDISPSHHS